jgi:uncharacterized phage protein (TIGR02220 family)
VGGRETWEQLVNFYKHYFGDYGRKTSHLSLTEHGAYRQLLDHYYATMTALPADLPSLRRICGAMTEEETEAVSKVVSAFFPLGPDGLRHNKRCDEEISHWKAQAEFNRMVGKLGGRPRKTQPVTEPVSEPVTEPLTEQEPERQPNRNPKLEVRSQKLEVKEKDIVGLTPDGYREQAIEVLTFLNRETGRSYRPVDANLRLITGRLREGATVDECKAVVSRKCAEWSGGDMEKYLRPATLFSAQKFAQYQGDAVIERVRVDL